LHEATAFYFLALAIIKRAPEKCFLLPEKYFLAPAVCLLPLANYFLAPENYFLALAKAKLPAALSETQRVCMFIENTLIQRMCDP
jgi:hypothetical protein